MHLSNDATNTIGFLTYVPFFDTHSRTYYNVLCINAPISGPLGDLIKHLYMPPISTYKNHTQSDHCYYVIQNHYSTRFQYYTLEQLQSLFLFMKQNKYTILHEYSSNHIPMVHNHVCMFSYSVSS